MPEKHRFKFLMDNTDPQEAHDWIQTQSAHLLNSEVEFAEKDPKAPWGLVVACKSQLNNIATWLTNGLDRDDHGAQDRQSNMLEAVVCASLRLQDPDLFGKALTLSPRLLLLRSWEKIGSTMELAHFSSYSHP